MSLRYHDISPIGDEESEPSPRSKRRRTKNVSRACNPCRQKKTRCSGERPVCALCMISNDECAYDTAQDRRRPVSKAYVAALEDRVAWLEGMLESRGRDVGSRAVREEQEAGTSDLNDSSIPEHLPIEPNSKARQEPVERLQIDNATGEVREYGPTSVFKHLQAAGASPAENLGGPHSSDHPTIRNLPRSFDKAMHHEALRVFFKYFNPWCWWVDEDRFRDDMGSIVERGSVVEQSLRTANYSPLLHFAILAIGVMYLDDSLYPERELISDTFAQNAASFFEEEIEAAKLSGVIGLMLLGSYHAGQARQSLGYIYSGTGMRLSRILGLGIDASSWVDKGLISLETKRSRDRVWHVAYIQDKLWSTYVGRAPAPTLSHWRMPFPTEDKEEDEKVWGDRHGFDSNIVQKSWTASVFTWTCKVARIIELLLINIYSTRGSYHSEQAQSTKFELRVMLEKWHEELPEPFRITSVMLRGQHVPITLPHVLTMNMMYHFAVILLNRPNYGDSADSPRAKSKPQGATHPSTATEKCNQAANKVMRLAEAFDRTCGLRHAPVSMTQFVFTAGTIHLLNAANGKNLESDTAAVESCINVLHSMGQTLKCASQSGDILQRLLHEWHAKLTNSGRLSTYGTKEKFTGRFNIQELLDENPEVSQQLQRLGWAPPMSSVPSLEAVMPSTFNTENTSSTTIPFATSETGAAWTSQPSGWTDQSYISGSPSIQEQSLFDMLMGNDGMAPEAWSNRLFNVEAGGAWPPTWGAILSSQEFGAQSNADE